MITRTMIVLALVSMSLAAAACDRSNEQNSTTQSRTPSDSGRATKADNTDRNKADRDSQTKTPIDQSNNSADVKTTAEIRRAIMEDKSMSVNAQNCKIVLDKGGVVTLRGPVDSQAEKDAIEAKAKGVAGVTRVVNELEVKTNG